MMSLVIFTVVLLLATCHTSSSFAVGRWQGKPSVSFRSKRGAWIFQNQHGTLSLRPQKEPYSYSPSMLRMYNLPPTPPPKGGPLREILTGAVTLLAIVAFFASPLGGIFFAIVNSFFVLSLLTPFVLWLGFQVWQFFFTIEGPCPNCSAPLRIVKDQNSPSFCLNCGTVVQATDDGNGIDFYYDKELRDQQRIVDEGYTASILDNLFGGGTRVLSTPEQRQAKYKRETTIIDVEFEERA
ncbi:hypothetical protein ACA910_001659 [Epithemia clementina (nom. ined.)]